MHRRFAADFWSCRLNKSSRAKAAGLRSLIARASRKFYRSKDRVNCSRAFANAFDKVCSTHARSGAIHIFVKGGCLSTHSSMYKDLQDFMRTQAQAPARNNLLSKGNFSFGSTHGHPGCNCLSIDLQDQPAGSSALESSRHIPDCCAGYGDVSTLWFCAFANFCESLLYM